MRHFLRTCLVALAAAAFPLTLSGQSVPAVTLDLTAGRGVHPERAGERWFRSGTSDPAAFGALTVRLGSRGRVRPVAVVEYSFDLRGDDVSLVCEQAPNGSCRVPFPSTTGVAGALGLRAAVTNRLLASVTAGVGRFDSPTRFVAADLSARLLPHVGVVAAVRHVVIADPGAPRTWFRPFTIGVRVQ